MDRFLLFPVFFPMLAGLFAFQLGRWQEKARDMFVLSATAMELLLVLTIWTNPELSQASVAVEGFCALGIRFQAGGFHTLMALLTAAGWLAASLPGVYGPCPQAEPVLLLLDAHPGGHHGGVPVGGPVHRLRVF